MDEILKALVKAVVTSYWTYLAIMVVMVVFAVSAYESSQREMLDAATKQTQPAR